MLRTYELPSKTACTPLAAGTVLTVLATVACMALALRVVIAAACGA